MFAGTKSNFSLTLGSSPVRNLDVRRATLPCEHIQDRNFGGAVGGFPTLLRPPRLASENPRYCEGASLQQLHKKKVIKTKFLYFLENIFQNSRHVLRFIPIK